MIGGFCRAPARPAVACSNPRKSALRLCWPGLFCLFILLARPLSAQSLPPCHERPTHLETPLVDITRFCIELVADHPDGGRLGYSALAVAPDGTLYATRPLTGEVFALRDGDGDGLPEQATRVIDGLTLPNGLLSVGDTLYISGGPHLYRWQAGALDVLVDDLPAGAGFWTGGPALGPDNRLYVGVGAPCDFCRPAPEQGAVLSFALDGSDRQLVATGLRHPADVAFAAGGLWTVDTASRSFAADPLLDELNRIEPGAHFGWPYCIGARNRAALPGGLDCAEASAPALSFPTHSTPVGLATYSGDALPSLQGRLLVVLQGSNNEAHMQGYALAAVAFDDAGMPAGYELIAPGQNPAETPQFSLQQLNFRTSGIWPRRPLDVAVSPEGWVYFSASDGRILALRPR